MAKRRLAAVLVGVLGLLVLVGGQVNNQALPLAPWIKAGETGQA
jgi:hypothetical protein